MTKSNIREIFKAGTITKQVATWAHSIRWVGNDAAHSNKEEVTSEDAVDILNLTEQIVNILYVMPAIAPEKNVVHGRATP